MFSFNGDFRRRPEQNLGGASRKHDRDALIKNAQFERQKREEVRRQVQGSIIVQSHIRSFLQRQQVKRRERKNFDEYIEMHSLKNIDDLNYLIKRILFFYTTNDIQDGNRLIFVCQYLIKNPSVIFGYIVKDCIWKYRINKMLFLCIKQFFTPELSQAIPFRMLEIFSSQESVTKHIPNDDYARNYLENMYGYLINRKYFNCVKRLFEEKLPPLDGPTSVPPNPQSAAILQMLVRPLTLVSGHQYASLDYKIMTSFIHSILSPELSESVQYLVLPYLSNNSQFPYSSLLKCICDTYQRELNANNSILIDLDDQKYNPKEEKMEFSSFLLYSLLTLDILHMEKLYEWGCLGLYIKSIAVMSHNILKLPKKSVQMLKQENSSDSDSDDRKQPEIYSVVEREMLRKTVQLLNSSLRVCCIVQHVDSFLDEPEILSHICQICHNLMIYNRLAAYEYKFLYMLAFKPKFIRTIWNIMTAQKGSQNFSCPLNLLSKGISIPEADSIIPLLATFCAIFSRLISTLHDEEFCQESNTVPTTTFHMMPFSIDEIVALSATLKDICLGLVDLAFPETRLCIKEHYRPVFSSYLLGTENVERSNSMWAHLFKVCVFLLRQIHTRDLRRGFCPENHWTVHSLNLPLDKPTDLYLQRRRRGPRPFQPIRDFTREDLENGPPLSTKQIRSITILREIPFVVSFNNRVNILQGLLAADKLRTQGDLQGFLQGPSIQIMVRRSHLYEDSFDKFSPENEPDLRPRFKVQMINAVGLEEVGIDGGGIFREFLSELIKTAFDPHRGFFMITTDNKLYPNPGVGKIVENYQKHYYFIGRILGKALYENLLVELPLAEFFLSKLAGKHSDVDIHQLASLDPVLHRNLLSLKAYEGDVADLGLDFTVVCDELGETRVEELKPNGSNIMVNSSNRIEYIQLMADYKLNKQIRRQCIAFREGLQNVLPIEWLYMFSNKELQVLISGAEIPVDIEDLKKNTRYGGNYNTDHPTITYFWRVLENFTDIQKRQLLKFVTSCSRPPLLGFKDLDPPFCIQDAGDTDRLPSASTCMNLLKLPPFKNEDILREKLLYAINSGTGFELS